MRDKFPLIMLTVFILASVHLAHAQPRKKIPRIGFLRGPEYPSVYIEAFRHGLREHGPDRSRTAPDDNDINFQPDQFGGQLKVAFLMALSISIFDGNILPLRIAQFPETLAKRFYVYRRIFRAS